MRGKKLLFSVFWAIACGVIASLSAAHAAPAITADAAILIEASTGRVLYQKNADEHMYPASTTKMMTAILALERADMKDVVTVSSRAAMVEDTYLEIGDKLLMRDMLALLMLESDNGAAAAIAEHMAGSDAAFAAEMNKKAKSLEAKSTNFMNPHGLPDRRHFSTAHDLARIAQYGMQSKAFREIVGTENSVVIWQYPQKQAVFHNTNNLLRSRPTETTGIKTGYTRAAGGCLAASAKRGTTELIAVVLHSASGVDRFSDAQKLLDDGFSRVHMEKGPTKADCRRNIWVYGGTSASVSVSPIKDVYYPLLEGERVQDFSIHYELPRIMEGGIQAGDHIGDLIVRKNGQEICRIPMLAEESVDKGLNVKSLFAGIFAGLGIAA
ncbi:D-alanyl-D-alanine carboxypeptidase family protein [Selenomonas sp. TAMA-11512]|uniref:D-alanyl-D-alanine carboxypeptidase family protein n=1 Tax=Selenomonas sp. TAMA-11512 TaxID=3095337 RepID=UPI00309271C5|nr:D-alanyl-D-alanine carboxypeptidase family protein [Selenomonas sp. TAMA-11512]